MVLLLSLFVVALPARAHPLSVSYVELRLDSCGMEACVEVQAADIAHELPRLSEKVLLTPGTLQAHQQEIAVLLTTRFTIGIAGRTLTPTVESIAPVFDQKSVRLRLRYVWQEPPASLRLHCRLFPYHPRHQTFVALYEAQELKWQMTFDDQTQEQDYAVGTRPQSVASVVWQFVVQGIYHIATGPDHLLFIVGLLLLGGILKQLLKIVTAFTIAHSVTLCLAALSILSPPSRIIEPAIAFSIVVVGVHSLLMRRRQREKSTVDLRLLFAFGFGFIHGFGFASALQALGLPRQQMAAALFSFNLGVECGQAGVVLTAAPLLAWLQRKNALIAQRFVTAGSLVVIVAGAFWFVQRVFAG